jgi:hypothetical protein
MPSTRDPSSAVAVGPGLIPTGVVTASSLLFVAGSGGSLPTVWTADLLDSTNVAQWVASISGHLGAGGTVALNITTLAYAATEVSPTITQTQLGGAGSAAGQPLIIWAQEGQAPNGPGGNLVLASGAGVGLGASGYVQVNYATALSSGLRWQLGEWFSNPGQSALYGNVGAPAMGNYVLQTGNLVSSVTRLNVVGAGGQIFFDQNGTVGLWGMGTVSSNPVLWANGITGSTAYALSVDAANQTLFLNAPGGTGFFIEIQLAAGTIWRLGRVGGPSQSALFGSAAPTASNYVMSTDNTTLFLNAPGGNGTFVTTKVNNAIMWQVGQLIGIPGSSAIYSDVTPNSTNYVLMTDNSALNLFLNAPGISNPFVITQVAGSNNWHLGGLVGTPSTSALYGNVTPSSTNYAFTTDGANVHLNFASSGFYVFFDQAGVSQFAISTNSGNPTIWPGSLLAPNNYLLSTNNFDLLLSAPSFNNQGAVILQAQTDPLLYLGVVADGGWLGGLAGLGLGCVPCNPVTRMTGLLSGWLVQLTAVESSHIYIDLQGSNLAGSGTLEFPGALFAAGHGVGQVWIVDTTLVTYNGFTINLQVQGGSPMATALDHPDIWLVALSGGGFRAVSLGLA